MWDSLLPIGEGSNGRISASATKLSETEKEEVRQEFAIESLCVDVSSYMQFAMSGNLYVTNQLEAAGLYHLQVVDE